jgi:hypothetical protein
VTPLQLAIQLCDTHMVRTLLQQGASSTGITPVGLSVIILKPSVFRALQAIQVVEISACLPAGRPAVCLSVCGFRAIKLWFCSFGEASAIQHQSHESRLGLVLLHVAACEFDVPFSARGGGNTGQRGGLLRSF